MSSSGSVQLVNVRTKPILISLSTKNGNNTGSSLHDVTWGMQESIGVIDQNFTAAISVSSMVFMNSFFNIIENENKLKIITVYYNAGALETEWIPVEVPIGNYSNVTLRNYLNTDGNCNTLDGTDWKWGLSVSTDPFTTSTSDPSAFNINFPSAGEGGELGDMVVAEQYTGVWLVVDDDTRPLMKLLGFLNLNAQGIVTNAEDVQVKATTGTVATVKAIGFKITSDAVGEEYNYTEPYESSATIVTKAFQSPNNADFSSPNALSVSWESVYSGTRNSFDNLSSGDTIAVVPVQNIYGDKCVYEPANPFKCIVPNFNVNEFHMVIKNADTGKYVNFRGNHWLITLMIEFFEIDNGYKSATAAEGLGRVVMPSMHSTVYDHNMPFSGTGGHINRHGRSTQYDEQGTTQSKRGRY